MLGTELIQITLFGTSYFLCCLVIVISGLNLMVEGSRSLSDSLAMYVLLNIMCTKLYFGPACKWHIIHGLCP